MRLPLSLRRRARRAFTIIELLVALAVTAIMITLMVNISINLLKAWNFTSGQLSAGNQARVALDYLSQDLQSAVLKRDGNIWLAATVQRNPPGANGDEDVDVIFDTAWTLTGGNIKPDGGGAVAAGNSLDLAGTLPTDNTDDGKIENVRFGKAGVWLRFFTTPPDVNTGASTTSAPRAVSYQLSRGRIGGSAAEAQYFYALFRSEVPPDATFAAGYNIVNAATYDAKAGTNGVIRTPTLNEIIANNVVDFGVRLFERDSSGALLEVFPARRNAVGALTAAIATAAPITYLGTTSTASYTSFGNNAGTNLTPGIPVAAEVMVRILTPEGQRILAAYEEDTRNLTNRPGGQTSGEYWWEIVNAHSRVYTRRIEIRGNAL
jgi:prepilin-type N-terminal cleavage/methylation domain-containing protein